MRFPSGVREYLLQNEWLHRRHFREWVTSRRTLADMPLKPPSGPGALRDLGEFRRFVEAWQAEDVCNPGIVIWQDRALQTVGVVRVPTHVRWGGIVDIAKFLGPDAVSRLRALKDRLAPFAGVAPKLREAAERQVHALEGLSVAVSRQLVDAIAQMRRGMGEGFYLRALPLRGIDTKLVERHRVLIETLLDGWLDGEVREAGGLLAWLGCLSKGQDRLMLRLLCPDLRAQFWSIDQMWVTSDVLVRMSPKAARVLVVENDVAGLLLPDMSGTLAVVGSGSNLAWLSAPWVQHSRVGYWGDLDSWGLRLLARARECVSHLEPLMMDLETWAAHPSAVVDELEPCEMPAAGLSDAEACLFNQIRWRAEGPGRLEQEKLSSAWIHQRVKEWMVR
jgi:hypothetical protein